MFPSHVYIWKFTENFPKICLEYISIKGIISGNYIGSTTSIKDMISRKYFTDILIIWLLTLLSPACCKVFLVEEELGPNSFLVTLEYLTKDLLKLELETKLLKEIKKVTHLGNENKD